MILGCDTTSQLYSIGKGKSLKKYRDFCSHAEVFNEVISAAGEQVLVTMHNGRPGESLDFIQYKSFCEKVATSKSHIQPQTLPPTSAAVKFHSLHVYYQILQCKGTGDRFLPEEWGWRESEKRLIPITTDLMPAPDDLLRIIRCNCQTNCSTTRCACH